MFLENFPIPLSGTLKNITPEQAKKLFNYDMPEGATGITFNMLSPEKIVLCPYFPGRHKNKDWRKRKKLVNNYETISKLMRIKKQFPENLKQVWIIQARLNKSYQPQNTFVSTNFKLIRQGLEHILVSVGNLKTPEILASEFKDNSVTLNFNNPNPDSQIGVIIVDKETLQLEHMSPKIYGNNTIEFKTNSTQPIVFLYAQKNFDSSNSVSIVFV